MNQNVLVELEFPSERLRLYNRLLTLFSKYGEEALKDCNATCEKHNKNVVTCWNLFTAATAAYNLGEVKKANVIYNHIDNQLSLIYKDEDFFPNKLNANHAYIFAIPMDGDVKAECTEEHLLNYNIMSTVKELEVEDDTHICIVTKIPNLGILDYSVENPLVKQENIEIDDETYFVYVTENAYDKSTHRIKFIIKNN